MTPEDVNNCLDKVLALPVRKRAYCLLLAAEKVQHLWNENCSTGGLTDHSTDLIDAFKSWYSEPKSPEDLKRISDLFSD